MNIYRKFGWLRLSAVALLFSVAFSSTALADTTGALKISVSDSDGNPIAGAEVFASSPDSLASKSGTTNAAGEIRLTGLDPAEN